MKTLFNTLCLISLMASWAFAQLPFGSFSAYAGNPVVPKTPGTWDQSAVW